MTAKSEAYAHSFGAKTPALSAPYLRSAAIAGAFTVFVAIASVWIALLFGVLQPWLDGAL